jgi:predicted transcriptional regulator
MQSNLLKKVIKDKGMTVTSVAKKVGITRETLYNRMDSGDFRASEIVAITNVLSLTKKERDDIFFTQ